jgi:hypothetical protein
MIALATALRCSIPATAAEGLPVAPFQARYAVYASGFAVGDAVVTLTAAGPNGYQMRSEVRPNGLVALLASGRIDEQARGEIHEGTIRPLTYERRLEAGKNSSHMQLRFNWPAGQVEARHNAEQATLPLTPGIVDPLSLQLLVMADLQRSQVPAQYRLIDKTEIKTYQIRQQGEETLNTPLGEIRTVRINQYTPGKTRMTTFWIAPDRQFLLVQIAQEKDGKEELRMEIRAVTR